MRPITLILLLVVIFSIGWLILHRSPNLAPRTIIKGDTTSHNELDSYNASQNKTSQNALTTTFFVVDGNSGVNVQKPTFTVNGKTTVGTGAFLTYMRTLSNGIYNVDIAANNYMKLRGAQISVPGNLRHMVIQMVPLTKAHNCPKMPTNNTAFVLCGYVTDESHDALAGVSISSHSFETLSAITSVDGYFEAEFLPLKNYDCGDPVTFRLSKQGYQKLNYVFNGPFIYMGGGLGTQFSLKRGIGTEQEIEKHGLCL